MSRMRIAALMFTATAIALGAAATFAFAQKPSTDRVEIVRDQTAGTASIVIDGKPVLSVDAKGLHVIGDIEYSGMVTDTQGGGHAE